jgi:hypothetical protein
VLAKELNDGPLEVRRGGTGGVEPTELRQGLAARGLLDLWELVHLLRAERLAQLPPQRQCRGFGRPCAAERTWAAASIAAAGGGGQDRADLRAHDPLRTVVNAAWKQGSARAVRAFYAPGPVPETASS